MRRKLYGAGLDHTVRCVGHDIFSSSSPIFTLNRIRLSIVLAGTCFVVHQVWRRYLYGRPVLLFARKCQRWSVERREHPGHHPGQRTLAIRGFLPAAPKKHLSMPRRGPPLRWATAAHPYRRLQVPSLRGSRSPDNIRSCLVAFFPTINFSFWINNSMLTLQACTPPILRRCSTKTSLSPPSSSPDPHLFRATLALLFRTDQPTPVSRFLEKPPPSLVLALTTPDPPIPTPAKSPNPSKVDAPVIPTECFSSPPTQVSQ